MFSPRITIKEFQFFNDSLTREMMLKGLPCNKILSDSEETKFYRHQRNYLLLSILFSLIKLYLC